MNSRIATAFLVVVLFLTSCGAVTPIPPTPTATLTLMPTRTLTPIIIPSPSTTASPTGSPFPTHPVQPTYDAYQTSIANVCPTLLSSSGNSKGDDSLSDSQVLREFAGHYGMSTGFQALSLILNCDGSFVGSSFADVGGGAFHNGGWRVENSMIYLRFDPTSEDIWFVSKILIPVRWGQRKYLIEDYQTDFFCEQIRSRKEPRKDSRIGYFLLRAGDEKIEATGFPIYPSGEKVCP